jgi:hypothetical protein
MSVSEKIMSQVYAVHTGRRLLGRKRAAGVLAVVLSVGAVAEGSWSTVNLHPGSLATSSLALDIRNGQIVGNFNGSAAQWAYTAASYVNLGGANATATDGSTVAGGGTTGGLLFGNPQIFNGGSPVNLDPVPAFPAYIGGTVESVDGPTQVGWVSNASFQFHAAHWAGSGASFTDLHPAGATLSMLTGTHGGQHSGLVSLPSGVQHAALWTGTSSSYVDLNPPGVTFAQAFDVHNGKQVGSVTMPAGEFHASLWSGSAASWVDLHPLGADNSEVMSVYDNTQVGYTSSFAYVDRAALWTGSASSYVDLHALLGSGYSDSRAEGVWVDGTTTYVVGYATRAASTRTDAILWINAAVPEPMSLTGLAAAGALTLSRQRRR